jgi:glutamate carboxypeptidase
MAELLNFLKQSLPAMTELLYEVVSIESQSNEKSGVDAVGRVIQRELARLNADIAVHPQAIVGDHVVGVWNSGHGSPIALYMHMDTVYPSGTLAQRPIYTQNGHMYGPGIYDMKASHVMALFALRALRELGQLPKREIRMVFTSDEEIGSDTSRQLIEDLARDAVLALVMEPALPDGKLKSARKGTGTYKVIARGKAAHAGGAHAEGINAVQELAHQVLKLQSLTDYARGITFSVGAIDGGGVTNVVPDYAELFVDTRVTTRADAQWVREQIYGLQPVLRGATLEVQGEPDRPPMPCDAGRLETVARIQHIGKSLGLDVAHGPSGGGSDASFTADIGTPTMDGLGAVGDGAHAVHENVLLSSLPERAALCAAILRDW